MEAQVLIQRHCPVYTVMVEEKQRERPVIERMGPQVLIQRHSPVSSVMVGMQGNEPPSSKYPKFSMYSPIDFPQQKRVGLYAKKSWSSGESLDKLPSQGPQIDN
ncbi:hypothetical protein AMTRI_Chr01g111580 [Amborella trichopoda]